MPELPEVETTARYLAERIQGESFTAVNVRWARTVHKRSPAEFCKFLLGKTVGQVWRRGKFIVISLQSQTATIRPSYLLFHLRMSGSLDVVNENDPEAKHDRLIISLSNCKSLRFHDPRKFGRAYCCEDLTKFFSHLGPEPLERALSIDRFHLLLLSRNRPLKSILLDQAFIAGVGNIYADEALWRARIHPLTRSNRLPRAKCEALLSAIRKVLREAIKRQGTDNGDGVVSFGLYRPRVYGREDKPCFRCHSKIRRIVVAQRGTSYCPRCQPGSRSYSLRSADKNSAAKKLS